MRANGRPGFMLAVAAVMTALGGCAGLEQFPDRSDGPQAKTLAQLDQEYASAIAEVYAETNETNQIAKRNKFIENRLGVVDANFKVFVQKLAKGNAYADLLVQLAEVGVGGAGAVVSGGASQVLSAVSGGLAGGKAAYDKAVLYDKTLAALVAQMAASRQTIAASILERQRLSVSAYPMWMARRDADAYEFAGSIPGAIIATADDAKHKSDRAEARVELILPTLTKIAVSKEMFELHDNLLVRVDQLTAEQAKTLVEKVNSSIASAQSTLSLYTPQMRADDPDGSRAKAALKEAISEIGTPEDAAAWQKEIEAL